MITWISKARALALVAGLGLGACDEVSLLSAAGGGSEPVRVTRLAGGTVYFATPQGYCIDRRSVRSRFALAGRCDTLDVEGFFAAWELAIVTVSLAPAQSGEAALGADTMQSALPGSERVIRTIERGGLTYTLLEEPGGTELDGVSARHWRTAFVLNGELVSLALYAPQTSEALGQEGARILQEMVGLTRAATRQATG